MSAIQFETGVVLRMAQVVCGKFVLMKAAFDARLTCANG